MRTGSRRRRERKRGVYAVINHRMTQRSACRLRAETARAVTLIELLVVVAIVSLLASILLLSLGRVRASSKNFECKNKLKTVGFDFLQFAEELSHPYRGDSEQLGRGGFHINDFQERVYRISEFWPNAGYRMESYRPQDQPLICPAGPQELQRRPRVRCENYAVWPVANVSTAFNMRLYKASVVTAGRPVLRPVRLSSRILAHPGVPLAFDVDGQAAASRKILPYYSAPPAGDTGLYASGLFWFPALRHQGRVNAAFVGGYVLSSRQPERDSGWNWKHQPPPE